MKKPTILFRADASSQIGYGHFIRSLALAEMLKNDFEIRFATVNPTGYQLQELSAVCSCIQLNQNSHFEDFLSLLTGNEIVVLDNYFFTTEYQQKIKNKGCKLVCIDDMHDRHYVADIVINHGVDDPTLFSVEPYTGLCLGVEWALLRKPFLEASSRNNPKNQAIKNIVVNFGGVDYHDITNKVIKKLKSQNPEIIINAIVGGGYSGKIESSDTVRFHQSVSAQKVADLFSQCDLAVLSASTICFEALACNTKIAAGYYVDNQIDIWEYLKKINAIYDIGFLLDDKILADSSFFAPSSYEEKTINFKEIPCNYIKKISTLKSQ